MQPRYPMQQGYPGQPQQPGYQGQPGYPGYPGYGYPPRPIMVGGETALRRTSAPRVLGIIAVVLSCIGLAASAMWTWGPMSDIDKWTGGDGSWSWIRSWLPIWFISSIVVFGLHLASGITAITYKKAAPALALAYGIAAIALILVDALQVLVVSPTGGPHHGQIYDSVVTMHLVFCAIALPWPIVMMAMMRTRRALYACGVVDDE